MVGHGAGVCVDRLPRVETASDYISPVVFFVIVTACILPIIYFDLLVAQALLSKRATRVNTVVWLRQSEFVRQRFLLFCQF